MSLMVLFLKLTKFNSGLLCTSVLLDPWSEVIKEKERIQPYYLSQDIFMFIARLIVIVLLHDVMTFHS